MPKSNQGPLPQQPGALYQWATTSSQWSTTSSQWATTSSQWATTSSQWATTSLQWANTSPNEPPHLQRDNVLNCVDISVCGWHLVPGSCQEFPQWVYEENISKLQDQGPGEFSCSTPLTFCFTSFTLFLMPSLLLWPYAFFLLGVLCLGTLTTGIFGVGLPLWSQAKSHETWFVHLKGTVARDFFKTKTLGGFRLQ